jgi:diguanylate cyclase (GGDEF)-like protein
MTKPSQPKLATIALDGPSTDFLAGTKSRAALLIDMNIEIQRSRHFGRPLTVAHLDLDDFKPINDKQGFPVGDAIVKDVGRGLLANIRNTASKDQIQDPADVVGRVAGDDFVILLPLTGYDDAHVILQRIHQAIPERTSPSVTCTIGAVTFTSPSPSQMVKNNFAP